MRTILVLLAFATIAHAVNLSEIIKDEFLSFKLEHKKNYDDELTERFRFKIYMENRHKIAKHNQLYAAGKVSYKLGLNKYADMSQTEFVQTMNGFNHTFSQSVENPGTAFIPPENVTIPESVDWRQKGAVTDVKDQGGCGACWAFSVTGALEGQHFRKSGVLISLSEQNLVDCSVKYGNWGCSGGWPTKSFFYIKENGGIDTEISYPYEGVNNTCRFNNKTVGATDRNFGYISSGNETQMMIALATVGPLSVTIDSISGSFHLYSEGVYDDPRCNSTGLKHALLAVGYGTDTDGKDYWLLKNSYSTTWGDKGYFKIARNKNNQCGIASYVYYPII